MKTPDNNMPDSHKKQIETTENKESLQLILQILKETAEKNRSLDQEAGVALRDQQDTETYKQKLNERAQLLIDLPDKLKKELVNIDPQLKQEIESAVQIFADEAQKRLEDKRTFALEGLLVHLGTDNENDLEELIADLEKK